jgi:hypothetical protein
MAIIIWANLTFVRKGYRKALRINMNNQGSSIDYSREDPSAEDINAKYCKFK